MANKTVIDKITLYEGECNTYYINDEKKVLIDAGCDFKGKVDLLVLTHYHPDHMLYADEIKKRTGCKIMISQADELPLSKVSELMPFWAGKKIKPVKPDQLLKQGDLINTGTYSFKVIETPGHSNGSIVLWELKKRILFSGDTLFSQGIGRVDLPFSKPELMQKSLEKITRLKPFTLLSGHGCVSELT